MIASNKCCDCGHEWIDKPMGFAQHYSCPACGSAYWEWVDYPHSDATQSSKKGIEEE